MNIPTKKLHNGFEIPLFGLGTWLMGGDKLRNPGNDDEGQIGAIRRAIEHGITHIDTAENYAEGHAEEIVGEAIYKLERKKLFIVTKVDKNHLKYDDLLNACKASLKRLKTDYLDLYLIHSPNDEVPLSQTMKAMDKLVAEGLAKNIGVSNFTTKRFMEAQDLTKNRLVINQVYYNLIVREPEKSGLLNYCQGNNVILEAYRPFDKGVLIKDEISLIHELSTKYNKTFPQIALNWLISQKNVVTISKITTLKHLEDNLGALDWNLSKEDIEKLRNHFPNQVGRSEHLPLK